DVRRHHRRRARLHGADHPARARPLHGGQGGGDAGRALRPVLPAAAAAQEDRRDRVRARLDPRGGLREDQRHDPRRGPPRRGPHPSLLLPAGVEASSGHRRRPARELRARVHPAAGGLRLHRHGVGQRSRRDDRTRLSGRRRARARRPDRLRRRPQRRSRAALRGHLRQPLRGAAPAQGLPLQRAGEPRGRARRPAPTGAAQPDLRPRGRAHAARVRLRARSARGPAVPAGRRPHRRPLRADHLGDHQGPGTPVRRREAQGDHRHRRHLRDHPAHDPRRRRRRSRHPRRDLPGPRGHQHVPVPAPRRRSHLLGRRREDPPPAGPVQRHGASRGGRLHARDGPVRDRVHQRPRQAHRRGLRRAI
ncbi:MAG: Membrane-associated zinc metalloprotease, partial [uncultured Solirubrobacterales bacterium]